MDETARKAAMARNDYDLEDFVYDLSNKCYWCLPTMTVHTADEVDAMIPKEKWEVIRIYIPKGVN